MALVYPLDILDGFPGWTTEFEPVFRQEQSRQANGVTRVKDQGSPIWRGAWQSKVLSANALDHWRARLEALEGGLKTFRGYSLSRCRPIAHPGSSALPQGALHTIGANRNAIRVNNIAGITLSIGDIIQIGDADIHRVMEPAAGTLTALFEVRPHLWPGVATGATVRLVKPSCIMTLVPGSVSSQADPQTGRGSISFQGMEAR